MAKTSKIEKEKRIRQMCVKYLARREALKAAVRNTDLPIEERMAASRKLAKMPRNASRIRQRNRCKLSGRPRGYLRKFGLSRIALRDLAHEGKIPGVTKSSW